MAKVLRVKKNDPSFLKTLWQGVLTLAGGVQPLVHQLKEDIEKGFEHYAQIIEKRLIMLAFRGSTLLISLFFVGFGLLFILMDYGGLSRGMACLCCGCVGLMVLSLSTRFTHKTNPGGL